MARKKEVTVIIPARITNKQQADWLGEAISSYRKQKDVGKNLIVVDDHSTYDDMDQFKDDWSWGVTWLVCDGAGLSAARNTAVKNVETEYFFPLDADDLFADDYVLRNLIDNYPGDGFLYGSTIMFEADQDGEIVSQTVYQAKPYDFEQLMEKVYFPNGCLQLVENWKRVGGYNEELSIYEDWDYWLRLGKIGVCGHHVDFPTYMYRQNTGGMIMTLRKDDKKVAEAAAMIRSIHPKIFKGEYPVGCCGGSRKRIPQPSDTVSNMGLASDDGMVLIKYIGNNHGDMTWYGRVTGSRYELGGKHDTGYVHKADVEYMLTIRENGQPQFDLAD